MKIRHEHIRMAMNAWAHPDGEKNSGVVTSDRKSNAASAGGPNAQPQFSLFSGAGGDAGTTGERR